MYTYKYPTNYLVHLIHVPHVRVLHGKEDESGRILSTYWFYKRFRLILVFCFYVRRGNFLQVQNGIVEVNQTFMQIGVKKPWLTNFVDPNS